MGGAGGLGQFLTRRQFGWDTQVGGIGGLGEEETDRRAAISILSMIFWLPSTWAGRGGRRGDGGEEEEKEGSPVVEENFHDYLPMIPLDACIYDFFF